MNASGKIRMTAALALIAGSMFAVGCESSGGGEGREGLIRRPGYEGDSGFPAEASAPAKAAAPAPAKAAAPAPAAPAQPARASSSGRGRGYNPNLGAGWNVSNLAFPTGDVNSSGLWIHHCVPAQVRSNSPYTYEIHATNLTDGTLQNVVVSNEGFNNLRITGSNPAGNTGANGAMMWALGNLGPGETKIIRVNALAEKSGVASGSCVSGNYNNTLCNNTQVVEPALQITKTLTPPEGTPCDSYTMTIEVKNPGTGAAENVVINDTFPPGMTTADGKTSLQIPVGSLAAGQARQFTSQVKVGKSGRYENDATATADGNLRAQSNKAAVVARQPNLTIDVECGGSIMIGRNAAAKITVCNKGDGVSGNTVVTAPIPAGATFVSADNGGQVSGGNVVWNLGNLAVNDCKTVNMVVRSGGMGDVTFTASANGTCANNPNDNCKVTVIGVPDIGTLITDGDGVVLVGDNHTYTCEVKNQGQVNLTNIKMVVALPEGLSFMSASGVGAPAVAGNRLTFSIGTVPVGRTVAFSFVAKASRSGELLIIGETTAAEIKTPIRDDELTVFVDR